MPQCIQLNTNDLCLSFLKLKKFILLQFQIIFAETHSGGTLDMEEKTRSNPFSISNILNNGSSRESHGRKELNNTSEAGGTLDRQRAEFTNKQGCEIHRPDASPSHLNRRMEYDFDDWNRASVEG